MRNLPSLYITPAKIPSHINRQWKSRAKAVTEFKKILDILINYTQDGKCAYCGLRMGKDVKRRMERDHVAPDATYSQFRFNPNNLVGACSGCNGFEEKGSLNTIDILAPNYEDCTFLIIHPRIDDINDYIVFAGQHENIPYPRNNCQKGQRHIDLFDLRNPTLIALRAVEQMASALEVEVAQDLARENAARGV